MEKELKLKFMVANENWREIKDKVFFDSFDDADKFAKERCKKLIDRRFYDEFGCNYMTSVKNDAENTQSSEMRHYSWYKINGSDFWISVKAFILWDGLLWSMRDFRYEHKELANEIDKEYHQYLKH